MEMLGRVIMRKFAVAALCVVAVTGSVPASADILVNVSKTSQRMSVIVDGSAKYNWLVSTGAKKFTTPSGVYKPEWLARKWKSKQYNEAPMPHSVFFYQGYAIHGTDAVSRLGRIASHGCVRLSPANAAKLYAMVQKNMANTRIVVSDDAIEKPGEEPKKKPTNRYVADNATGDSIPSGVKLEAIALASPSALSANALAVDTPSAIQKVETPAVKQIDASTGVRFEISAKADKAEKVKPQPQREARARDNRPGFHW
jgi:hypothetical protein